MREAPTHLAEKNFRTVPRHRGVSTFALVMWRVSDVSSVALHTNTPDSREGSVGLFVFLAILSYSKVK